MFEFVRKHTRIIQFALLLLIFPSFVFFGVQGFSSLTKDDDGVASVDGHSITRAEFDNAVRMQQDRVRSQSPNVDQRLLESPQFKEQVFDSLVQERVLAASVDKLHLATSDSRLQRLFAGDPQMQAIRNPDGWINKEFLAARGITSAGFAEQLRRDYSTQQVLGGISASAMPSTAAINLALDAVLQRREIQLARFEAKDYLVQAQPSAADLTKDYADPAIAKLFQAPERAKVEYLVLDLEGLKQQIAVSEDDIRKFYEDNGARFVQPEERRASHILVKAERNLPAPQRQAARAKAEALLAAVRKDPQSFAEVALKNSDDPGSAAKGGDLDFFNRDAMTKPFADAAFALKRGQISDIVESDFGFHVILLTDVRGGTKVPFDAVRKDIESELKTERAKRAYAQAAEQFTNTVYEQSDSLKPAADLLKLPIRTADVTRDPGPGTPTELLNPKLLHAIFDATNIKQKRNTEAIDVGSSRLISAHVVQYTPAHSRPFAEVEQQVRANWIRRRSLELAKQAATRSMEDWRRGATGARLSAPQLVSRNVPVAEAPAATATVLRAPVDKLPAWVLLELDADQGYAVARINRVLPADVKPQERQAALAQYAKLWSGAEARAYYASLKTLTKAKVGSAASAAIGATEAASATLSP